MSASGTAGRLLCIGDVHGCLMELTRLLDGLGLTADDRLVFLGDYIDRGDASAQVVDLLLEVREGLPETVFLRGNHEQMLLDFLTPGGEHGHRFVRAGGGPTLLSYGVDPGASSGVRDALRRNVEGEHLEFYRSLRLSHSVGPYAFVHAGVRPGVALDDQHVDDLLWIREEFFIGEHDLDETVIFGHTPQRDVQFSAQRWIAMDTGCVYGGRLSALDLTGGLLHQVRKDGAEVEVREVADALERARG